jgi:hypothetical protein
MSEQNSEMRDDEAVRVGLSRPIKAFGELKSVLEFREPLGADIAKHGNPVKMGLGDRDAVQMSFDERKMTHMIAELASVPVSAVEKMRAADWAACAYAIAVFFVPGVSSDSPSGSPDTTASTPTSS